MSSKPIPSPEQALHVLEILGKWTARGWQYEAYRSALNPDLQFVVGYTDPEGMDIEDPLLSSRGVDHFGALCQATTVMQVLLEEHPEKT